MDWMIYGASGYTGSLVAREAVKRGHRPGLAGRSSREVASLGQELGLEHRVFGLDQRGDIQRVISSLHLVYNAAGPYQGTADPMLEACLENGVHYIDLCGEIEVLKGLFQRHKQAISAEVALVPAAGFVVVPADCLAQQLANRIPRASTLEVAVATTAGPSPGTVKSAMESIKHGALVRRGGELLRVGFGRAPTSLMFPDGTRSVIPAPQADLVTAFHSTGIPNITAYLAIPQGAANLLRITGPLIPRMLEIGPLRSVIRAWAGRMVAGPTAQERQVKRSYVWVRVANEAGAAEEAWADTPEAYRFSAVTSVDCVERVLRGGFIGAQTPAQVLEADYLERQPELSLTSRSLKHRGF